MLMLKSFEDTQTNADRLGFDKIEGIRLVCDQQS